MKGHMIVCGAGTTGRYIIEELLMARVPVVVLDADEHVLTVLREHHPAADLTCIAGDATDDELLTRAGIADAAGLAATLPSDKDNLYLVVSTRLTNPTARIVARATELSHIEKMKRAGADSIVSPSFIGSRRMVSEMLRPTVVRFLDDMLKDTRAIYRMYDVMIEAGSSLAGVTLGDAKIRETFGMSVLAIADGNSPWRYNPDDTERLVAGTTLIVLGSLDQVDVLRAAAKPTSAS